MCTNSIPKIFHNIVPLPSVFGTNDSENMGILLLMVQQIFRTVEHEVRPCCAGTTIELHLRDCLVWVQSSFVFSSYFFEVVTPREHVRCTVMAALYMALLVQHVILVWQERNSIDTTIFMLISCTLHVARRVHSVLRDSNDLIISWHFPNS